MVTFLHICLLSRIGNKKGSYNPKILFTFIITVECIHFMLKDSLYHFS